MHDRTPLENHYLEFNCEAVAHNSVYRRTRQGLMDYILKRNSERVANAIERRIALSTSHCMLSHLLLYDI
jgi:hypothetical protein